jgi:hypothetical protein
VFAQPLLVVRRQPVLPLRDRDVGVDVNLAAAEDPGGVQDLLGSVLRIGFPWILGTLKTGSVRVLPSGRQRAVAEHHQRLRVVRVLQQQRGEYP